MLLLFLHTPKMAPGVPILFPTTSDEGKIQAALTSNNRVPNYPPKGTVGDATKAVPAATRANCDISFPNKPYKYNHRIYKYLRK